MLSGFSYFSGKEAYTFGTEHRAGGAADSAEHRQYRAHLRCHRRKAPSHKADGIHPGRQTAKACRTGLLALPRHHLLRRAGRLLRTQRWGVFLLLHQGGEHLQRRQLPGQELPVLRAGGRRAARTPAVRKQEAVRPHPHARNAAQPESVEQRGNRGLRGAEAVGLPGAANKGRLREFDWNNAD